MKTRRIIQFLLAACLALPAMQGCNKDDGDAGDVTVQTVSLRNVTYTTAECVAEVTGGASERGVCLSETPNPTVSNTKVSGGKGSGKFTVNFSGLGEGKEYYVRAYAYQGSQVVYGSEQYFRTYEKGQPIAALTDVNNVTINSAQFTGRLVAEGGSAVTEMGVCYGTSPAPTVSNSKVVADGTALGIYQMDVSGLADGTKYYARFYAVNSTGTAYSHAELSFTTIENFPVCGLPVLSNAGETSIDVKAKATQSGQRTILSWGVCWSTSQNPTIANNKVQLSTASGGEQTGTITGLSESMTIYVRTYATTALSTTYGPQAEGRTLRLRPSVETGTGDASCPFKYSTVITGCRITDLGERDYPVTQAGMCYSLTNALPTLADNVVTQTNLAVGAMEDMTTLVRLIPGKKFYVRAFATNQVGTNYGSVVEVAPQPEYRTLIPSGGTAPTLPNFNGLRFYYLDKATASPKTGTGDRTPGLGVWQLQQLDLLNTAFGSSSSRYLDYMYLTFTSNLASTTPPLAAGTESYMLIYFGYRSSAHAAFLAATAVKYAVDSQGLYTFSDNKTPDNDAGPYNNFRDRTAGSANIKTQTDRFITYLTDNTFMLEREADTEAGYLLIPIADATHYYKFEAAGYTAATTASTTAQYLTPW